MKKKLFIMCAALMWTTFLMAQNISVVTANGATTLVRSLDDAIAIVNENPGCVVYLPGGGHSISDTDNSRIKKKVTIIGIGHRMKGENADGFTTISGHIWFDAGSDGSAILGCYLTGNVNIVNGVNDVLIRYCNMNDVNVKGSLCKGTVVNQCYIRGGAYFNSAEGEFTHNISTFLYDLDRGTIEYNIFTSSHYTYRDDHAIKICDDCSINHNIIISWATSPHTGSNCQITGNMAANAWGEDPVTVGGADWNSVFVKPSGANSTSDYHFKEEYKQYESQVGVYVGNQFNDTGLPPVPYIVAKQIPMETDATGKLNIKIRVNAGQ